MEIKTEIRRVEVYHWNCPDCNHKMESRWRPSNKYCIECNYKRKLEEINKSFNNLIIVNAHNGADPTSIIIKSNGVNYIINAEGYENEYYLDIKEEK